MAMRTFENQDEAREHAAQAFEPGSRWLKVVKDRRFIVELSAGGELVEWHEDEPADTWTGTWATGIFYNTPWWEVTLHLYFRDYRTRARLQKDGSFEGFEVSPEAWEAADPRERETHPDLCFHNEPRVTLERL